MKELIKAILRGFYSFPFGRESTKNLLLSDQEKTFLNFQKEGFFPKSGWTRSWQEGKPVSPNNEPRPWLSFPANCLLEERLKKNMKVFEFGSGNSTLFLGSRVGLLHSVEHDKEWFEKSDPKPYQNTEIFFCPLENGSYPDFPRSIGQVYDLILIDGRERVACAKASANCLSSEGVIIFDDSERDRYSEGLEFLTGQGFRKLDLWGISLGDFKLKNTSIFYRENNCLGI